MLSRLRLGCLLPSRWPSRLTECAQAVSMSVKLWPVRWLKLLSLLCSKEVSCPISRRLLGAKSMSTRALEILEVRTCPLPWKNRSWFEIML